MAKTNAGNRSIKFPPVKLIISGTQKVNQDYNNLEVIQESPDNTPEFFNRHLEHVDNQHMYMFMSPYDEFYTTHTISTMVNKLMKFPMMNVVYSDTMIKRENLARQWLPPFSPTLFEAQFIINIPFLATGSALVARKTMYNPLLERLYQHEFLIRLIRRVLPIHIAEPLFISILGSQSIDLSNDVKVLEECLGQQDTSVQ
jgi:hypothetical protein